MLQRCDRGGKRGQKEEPGPPSPLFQPRQSVKVWPESWPVLWRPCPGLRAAVCFADQSLWRRKRAGVRVLLQRRTHPGLGRHWHNNLWHLDHLLYIKARFNPVLCLQALICSCFIPIYCGLIPPSFRGVVGLSGWIDNHQGLALVSPFGSTIIYTISSFTVFTCLLHGNHVPSWPNKK